MLLCADETYYVGSTKYLRLRVAQHQEDMGANYTKERRPLQLAYFEQFDRIDWAFHREHQIKKWSKEKKHALVTGSLTKLKSLSKKKFPK